MLVKLIERVKMTKGQRAGDGPIAVEVEKDKSYYWCACGLSKKNKKKNNHSAMDHIVVQNLNLFHTKH
jgi:hypothetical protein